MLVAVPTGPLAEVQEELAELYARGLRRPWIFRRSCAWCGRTLFARTGQALYCPDGPGGQRYAGRCKTQAYLARREERNQQARRKTCQNCGQTVSASRRDALYCKPACLQQAYRERTKGVLIPSGTERNGEP